MTLTAEEDVEEAASETGAVALEQIRPKVMRAIVLELITVGLVLPFKRCLAGGSHMEWSASGCV